MVAVGLTAVVVGWSLPATAASSRSNKAPTTVTCPQFAARNFSSRSTTINNPYLPLPVTTPATKFIYDGKTKGHALHDVVTVTGQTKVLAGVTTVVVDDEVSLDNTPTESTLDYFAQDRAGNVWYFGEDSTEIDKNGNTSTGGSWHAGDPGAQPGFIMEATPKVGDSYCQENVPGVAQDEAQVVAVLSSFTLQSGTTYSNVLETKEFTPLEPGKTENKFYAPGVGEIESVAITGGTEEQELSCVTTATSC